MSLRFAVVVSAPAYGSQQSATAYRFATEVVRQGHQLSHIFFYQEGVGNANGLHYPPSDEVNLVTQWQQLAQSQNIELDVCVAAALRRGVLDQQESHTAGFEQHNLIAPFRLSGLGQLAEALLTADRVVQF